MGSHDLKSPEIKFWEWFSNNSERVLKICDNQQIAKEIAGKLKTIYSGFSFEIGETNDGKFEFVISCKGMNEGIPFVERLVDSAPGFEHIKIVKFRQAKGCEYAVKIDNIELGPEDIWFQYCFDEKVHLQLFIPGYSDRDQRYGQLAFLLLDNMLGEYFIMTKIGYIDFQPLTTRTDLNKLLNLKKLPDIVSAMMN